MIYCAVVNGIRQVVNGTLRALLKAARGVITIVEKVYHGISGICGQIPLLGWLCYLFAGLLKLLIELAKGIHWLFEQLVIGIEAALEYIYWAIGWIVWAIYWGFRVIDLGFCMANPHSVRYIHLCVKILADRQGNVAASRADVYTALQEAAGLFEKCGIILSYTVNTVAVDDTRFRKEHDCGARGLFSNHWIWFSKNTGSCCLTMYVVQHIKNLNGCAFPGSNWFIHDGFAVRNCIVHEIGHLCDLWGHSSVSGNLMYVRCGTDIDKIQCCMIRTSRFVTASPLRP